MVQDMSEVSAALAMDLASGLDLVMDPVSAVMAFMAVSSPAVASTMHFRG
ncbi:hypothetical protein PAENIP36_14910 [Paenibacillus sp. P36]